MGNWERISHCCYVEKCMGTATNSSQFKYISTGNYVFEIPTYDIKHETAYGCAYNTYCASCSRNELKLTYPIVARKSWPILEKYWTSIIVLVQD
jgi:hypothetical protein